MLHRSTAKRFFKIVGYVLTAPHTSSVDGISQTDIKILC